MTTQAIAQIEAALAAGPTDGPWFICRDSNDDGTVDIETGRIAQSEWPPAQNCEYGTAEYIAACNPAAMREVLDHIAKQATEIARLRAVLEKLARLGNGDSYGNSIGNDIARAALTTKDTI